MEIAGNAKMWIKDAVAGAGLVFFVVLSFVMAGGVDALIRLG